jgi:hypothetical protein
MTNATLPADHPWRKPTPLYVVIAEFGGFSALFVKTQFDESCNA